MPVLWLVAIGASALVALVTGLLALRTSGVYFIMITLAFGQMFYYFSIGWARYGGEDGLSIYVRNGFPGVNTLQPLPFFALCLGSLCAALWLCGRLASSPFGLALGAARQAPGRVEAVGLDPGRLKLVAFVVSGAITGLAGALFRRPQPLRQPDDVQLADERRDHRLRHPRRRRAAVRAGGRCAAVRRARALPSGGLSDYWQIYLGLLLLGTVLFGRGGLVGILSRPAIARD